MGTKMEWQKAALFSAASTCMMLSLSQNWDKTSILKCLWSMTQRNNRFKFSVFIPGENLLSCLQACQKELPRNRKPNQTPAHVRVWRALKVGKKEHQKEDDSYSYKASSFFCQYVNQVLKSYIMSCL